MSNTFSNTYNFYLHDIVLETKALEKLFLLLTFKHGLILKIGTIQLHHARVLFQNSHFQVMLTKFDKVYVII